MVLFRVESATSEPSDVFQFPDSSSTATDECPGIRAAKPLQHRHFRLFIGILDRMAGKA